MIQRFVLSLFFLSCLLPMGTAQVFDRITSRYDFRRSLNNRYIGLVYGEYRTSLHRSQDGSFLISQFNLEELSHDGRLEKRLVEDSSLVEVALDSQGVLEIPPDRDVMVFQNYPAQPPEQLQEGYVWQALGAILVDPDRSGEMTRIPIIAEYRVRGTGEYLNQEVWVVESLFALRYRGDDPFGDPSLTTAQGRHSSITYFSQEGVPLFFRSTVDEQFTFATGDTIENQGFVLTWFEDVQPLPRQQITNEIQNKIASLEIPDISLSENLQGVLLSMQNLLFVADQPVLLPGEEKRLKAIADVLNQYPERRILITGHTADVGSRESQVELSIQRAQTIADRLINLGVQATRLMYQGVGGDEPVGDNSTEEGRQQNRRVEILILDS